MHLANCREIWNWDSENSEKWMIARVADALGLTSVSRSLSQLGSAGFQDCLWELIDHGQGRHRSAICLHGFHQVHRTTATAFSQWLTEYVRCLAAAVALLHCRCLASAKSNVASASAQWTEWVRTALLFFPTGRNYNSHAFESLAPVRLSSISQ